MLRRKILASAMASVMALTSTAIIANADDAVVASNRLVLKAKEDLKAVLDKYASDRNKALEDFGSICGEQFLDAMEYGENVYEGYVHNTRTVSEKDYTVAAQMIEATHSRLVKKTYADLKELIDRAVKVVDKGNILNEDLGDNRYNPDKFAKLEDKLSDAESILDSEDSRLITDAWYELDAALNIDPLPIVSKSEFRQVLKNYDLAIAKEFKYEPWRRGSMNWTNEGALVSYGVAYGLLDSINERVHAEYEKIDQIRALYSTSQDEIVKAYNDCKTIVDFFNTWAPDDTDRARKADVASLLSEYHGRLVFDFNNQTTPGGANAYNLITAISSKVGEGLWLTVRDYPTDVITKTYTAQERLDMVDAKWDPTDPSSTTSADELWLFKEVDAKKDVPSWDKAGFRKLAEASLLVRSDTKFFIPLDENGHWIVEADISTEGYKVGDVYGGKKIAKIKTVNKKSWTDLSEYLDFDTDDIADVVAGDPDFTISNGTYDVPSEEDAFVKRENGNGWHTAVGGTGAYDPSAGDAMSYQNTTVDIELALTTAIDYINGVYGLEDKINDIGTIPVSNPPQDDDFKGSVPEWALVHRYLQYALSDRYGDYSDKLNVRADVRKLIDDSYDLTERTGDASLFSKAHMDFIDMRRDAIDWLKDVDKKKGYVDNQTPGEFQGGDALAYQVYGALKSKYDDLDALYQAFKYSYDDVYNYIYQVCDGIDNGTIKATDEVLTALDKTAYLLSTAEPWSEDDLVTLNGATLDNDAFTSDRIFMGFNRVYTKDGDLDKGGVKVDGDSSVRKNSYKICSAYEELMAAVKAQTEAVLLGDVNGDGVVNPLDAQEILKSVVGLRDPIDAKVGDVNADTKVDQNDAVKVLKDYVGLK